MTRSGFLAKYFRILNSCGVIVSCKPDGMIEVFNWRRSTMSLFLCRVTMPRLEEMFPSLIKVRRTELILFSRQLATFIQVGVPMLEGLAVLRDQASSRLMKKALTEIITDVTTGASLSHAMSKLDLAAELTTAHFRQLEVEDHKGRRRRAECLEARSAVGSDLDRITL